MRGSSLKLIESVASGRVCVTTRDGARGFTQAGISSLIVVDRIEDFFHPIEELIGDEALRVTLERPDPETLAPFSWKHAASVLSEIIADRMKDRP
jgi:hypothetical protein